MEKIDLILDEKIFKGNACRFCGHTNFIEVGEKKFSVPGTECCKKSLERQIEFRQQEMDSLERKMKEHISYYERAEKSAIAYGGINAPYAIEARSKYDSAQRNIEGILERLKNQRFNLSKEVERLKRLSNSLDK